MAAALLRLGAERPSAVADLLHWLASELVAAASDRGATLQALDLDVS